MYSVFLELLKERNLKPSDVSRITGISGATLSDWKSGRSVPKADKLKMIADFFEVPLEYLMTGVQPAAASLDPRRKELLSLFDQLNSIGQDKVMEYLDDLVRSGKYEKKTQSSSRSVG